MTSATSKTLLWFIRCLAQMFPECALVFWMTLVFNAGMAMASTAFLPSTFAMHCLTAATVSFLNYNTKVGPNHGRNQSFKGDDHLVYIGGCSWLACLWDCDNSLHNICTPTSQTVAIHRCSVYNIDLHFDPSNSMRFLLLWKENGRRTFSLKVVDRYRYL